MVEEGVLHDGPLWNGRKRRGTSRFHMRLQLLLLPPSRRNQLLKLMATGWRFVAGDAALSFRIASNASR